jgi:hypothetical protein
MTNPADENSEIESLDVATEVVSDDETVEDDDQKSVSSEDEKPMKKKVAELKARHNLENYFELKSIRESLDYLYDEKAKDE